jgi:hypothetical protein
MSVRGRSRTNQLLALPGLSALALVWPGTAAAEPTTTINGSPPPGVVQPLEDVTTMIDTIRSDGNRLLVAQGTRKAGTRAPIHFMTTADTPAC